jgi:5,6-dimethylbenzimidazole synthase
MKGDLAMHPSYTQQEKEIIYRVIRERRDIRHFLPDPVPESVLARILEAAHYAPSVGFMQPWNFILITSRELRRQVKASFERVNQNEWAKLSDDERQALYSRLKLEGIMEAPINLAVTCDHRRDAPFVLGRAPMPETDVYSTCLAVQNLWLAARAEGVGVGWVSLLEKREVEKLLGLPDGVELVAYLCVGYPVEFRPKPMLEEKGWKSRMDWRQLVYENGWGDPVVSYSLTTP